MSFRCRINHTVILDDPFDDPPDLPVPDRSPEPTKEQLDVSAVLLLIHFFPLRQKHKAETDTSDHPCLANLIWTNKHEKCIQYMWKQYKLTTVHVQSGRIGADEAIDDMDGKGAEELEERLKEKEAKTQAILLEMVRSRNLLSAFNWRYQSCRYPSTLLSFIPPGGRPPWRRHEASRERVVCVQTEPSNHRRGPGNHLFSLWVHKKVTPTSKFYKI